MIFFEDLEAVCYTTRGMTDLEGWQEGQGKIEHTGYRGAVPRDAKPS
jgi:hypothetical protein